MCVSLCLNLVVSNVILCLGGFCSCVHIFHCLCKVNALITDVTFRHASVEKSEIQHKVRTRVHSEFQDPPK